jgi:hypothetical protein
VPLWVSAYFAIYLTFCIWANVDGIKNKTNPLWFEIVDAASSTCLVFAALSYWHPFQIPTVFFLGLFVVGVFVFVKHAVVSCRKHLTDSELSFHGKLFIGISGSLLALIVSAPILYWGFNATVLANYADTYRVQPA